MKAENRNVLAFMAHPDDAEFLCAGTLSRLRRLGYQVHIATMTAGDGGSMELPNEEIARIRYVEAERAAAILDADYQCAHGRDFFLSFNPTLLQSVIEIIRNVDPMLVITHSPQDYITDHEVASQLVRAACFAAPAPNARTSVEVPAKPVAGVPYLYYADAIEGKDIFGNPITPGFYVDVTAELETKKAMLACHESQREWLLRQHQMDHYIEYMKSWAAHRGIEAGVEYAEVFRQHRGHGYPHENALLEILGAIPPA